MRDCVVLGCGRSGTSALAGTLADAGWHLGDRLLGANPDNPKGYFEDLAVNRLNEQLLAPVCTEPPPGAARPMNDGERWLAALAPDVVLPPRPDLAEQLAAASAGPDGRPVCRKDPRFSWTLPAWEPLAGALRVVVFRDPSPAATSLVRMQAGGTLGLPYEGALQVWAAVYRRVLALAQDDWLFVSYASVLDGSALPRLAAALGAEGLPGSFVDRGLQRSPDDRPVPPDVADLHRALLERSR